jgi:hypothetical protein
MASSRQRHRTKEGILDNISTLTKLGNKHLEIFLRWQGKVRWACSLTKLVISSVSIRVSA